MGLYTWGTRPNERFGLLLAATGAALLVTTLSETSDSVLYSVGRIAGWLVELLVVYLILAFPSGRLTTHTDRTLVGAMSALVAVAFVPQIVLAESFSVPSPYTSCTADCPSNAFLVFDSEPGFVDTVLSPAASILLIAALVAVLLRLTSRIRAATPLARHLFTPVLRDRRVQSGAGRDRIRRTGVRSVGVGCGGRRVARGDRAARDRARVPRRARQLAPLRE